MADEVKRWKVKYSHKDGRSGEVEVTTKVEKTGGFDYGNGKAGALIINAHVEGYDLRYSNEKDLHRVMLKDYFGNGLVDVVEI